MGKVVDVSLETASADTISDRLSHLFVSPISQELATITKESFRDLTVALAAILRVPFVSLGNEWSSLFSQSRTPTSEVLPKLTVVNENALSEKMGRTYESRDIQCILWPPA